MPKLRLPRVGDRVYLNSGGPIMSVSSVLKYSRLVKCVWFDLNFAEINKGYFSFDQLILLDEDEKSDLTLVKNK